MYEAICFADAAELAKRIGTKALSPVEVVNAHLERIAAINPKINAIVAIADDSSHESISLVPALLFLSVFCHGL